MTPAETEAEGQTCNWHFISWSLAHISASAKLVVWLSRLFCMMMMAAFFAHSRNCNFCGAMLRGYFCLGNDPCNAPRHRQIQNVMKPNLGPASPINIHSALSFHRFIANILPRSFSYKNLPKNFISRFLRFHWIWTNRCIATTICLTATALSRVPRSTCGQIIKRLSEFGKGKQIRVRVRGANETEEPSIFL